MESWHDAELGDDYIVIRRTFVVGLYPSISRAHVPLQEKGFMKDWTGFQTTLLARLNGLELKFSQQCVLAFDVLF
ncbi:hypothetical protein NC651_020242 [Populus alba x Populus x berolinensis]|nr:hypothetical protein NC651_020242 [Populus alba x Populus x berolinensis]